MWFLVLSCLVLSADTLSTAATIADGANNPETLMSALLNSTGIGDAIPGASILTTLVPKLITLLPRAAELINSTSAPSPSALIGGLIDRVKTIDFSSLLGTALGGIADAAASPLSSVQGLVSAASDLTGLSPEVGSQISSVAGTVDKIAGVFGLQTNLQGGAQDFLSALSTAHDVSGTITSFLGSLSSIFGKIVSLRSDVSSTALSVLLHLSGAVSRARSVVALVRIPGSPLAELARAYSQVNSVLSAFPALLERSAEEAASQLRSLAAIGSHVAASLPAAYIALGTAVNAIDISALRASLNVLSALQADLATLAAPIEYLGQLSKFLKALSTSLIPSSLCTLASIHELIATNVSVALTSDSIAVLGDVNSVYGTIASLPLVGDQLPSAGTVSSAIGAITGSLSALAHFQALYVNITSTLSVPSPCDLSSVLLQAVTVAGDLAAGLSLLRARNERLILVIAKLIDTVDAGAVMLNDISLMPLRGVLQSAQAVLSDVSVGGLSSLIDAFPDAASVARLSTLLISGLATAGTTVRLLAERASGPDIIGIATGTLTRVITDLQGLLLRFGVDASSVSILGDPATLISTVEQLYSGFQAVGGPEALNATLHSRVLPALRSLTALSGPFASAHTIFVNLTSAAVAAGFNIAAANFPVPVGLNVAEATIAAGLGSVRSLGVAMTAIVTGAVGSLDEKLVVVMALYKEGAALAASISAVRTVLLPLKAAVKGLGDVASPFLSLQGVLGLASSFDEVLQAVLNGLKAFLEAASSLPVARNVIAELGLDLGALLSTARDIAALSVQLSSIAKFLRPALSYDLTLLSGTMSAIFALEPALEQLQLTVSPMLSSIQGVFRLDPPSAGQLLALASNVTVSFNADDVRAVFQLANTGLEAFTMGKVAVDAALQFFQVEGALALQAITGLAPLIPPDVVDPTAIASAYNAFVDTYTYAATDLPGALSALSDLVNNSAQLSAAAVASLNQINAKRLEVRGVAQQVSTALSFVTSLDLSLQPALAAACSLAAAVPDAPTIGVISASSVTALRNIWSVLARSGAVRAMIGSPVAITRTLVLLSALPSDLLQAASLADIVVSFAMCEASLPNITALASLSSLANTLADIYASVVDIRNRLAPNAALVSELLTATDAATITALSKQAAEVLAMAATLQQTITAPRAVQLVSHASNLVRFTRSLSRIADVSARSLDVAQSAVFAQISTSLSTGAFVVSAVQPMVNFAVGTMGFVNPDVQASASSVLRLVSSTTFIDPALASTAVTICQQAVSLVRHADTVYSEFFAPNFSAAAAIASLASSTRAFDVAELILQSLGIDLEEFKRSFEASKRLFHSGNELLSIARNYTLEDVKSLVANALDFNSTMPLIRGLGQQLVNTINATVADVRANGFSFRLVKTLLHAVMNIKGTITDLAAQAKSFIQLEDLFRRLLGLSGLSGLLDDANNVASFVRRIGRQLESIESPVSNSASIFDSLLTSFSGTALEPLFSFLRDVWGRVTGALSSMGWVQDLFAFVKNAWNSFQSVARTLTDFSSLEDAFLSFSFVKDAKAAVMSLLDTLSSVGKTVSSAVRGGYQTIDNLVFSLRTAFDGLGNATLGLTASLPIPSSIDNALDMMETFAPQAISVLHAAKGMLAAMPAPGDLTSLAFSAMGNVSIDGETVAALVSVVRQLPPLPQLLRSIGVSAGILASLSDAVADTKVLQEAMAAVSFRVGLATAQLITTDAATIAKLPLNFMSSVGTAGLQSAIADSLLPDVATSLAAVSSCVRNLQSLSVLLSPPIETVAYEDCLDSYVNIEAALVRPIGTAATYLGDLEVLQPLLTNLSAFNAAFAALSNAGQITSASITVARTISNTLQLVKDIPALRPAIKASGMDTAIDILTSIPGILERLAGPVNFAANGFQEASVVLTGAVASAIVSIGTQLARLRRAVQLASQSYAYAAGLWENYKLPRLNFSDVTLLAALRAQELSDAVTAVSSAAAALSDPNAVNVLVTHARQWVQMSVNAAVSLRQVQAYITGSGASALVTSLQVAGSTVQSILDALPPGYGNVLTMVSDVASLAALLTDAGQFFWSLRSLPQAVSDLPSTFSSFAAGAEQLMDMNINLMSIYTLYRTLLVSAVGVDINVMNTVLGKADVSYMLGLTGDGAVSAINNAAEFVRQASVARTVLMEVRNDAIARAAGDVLNTQLALISKLAACSYNVSDAALSLSSRTIVNAGQLINALNNAGISNVANIAQRAAGIFSTMPFNISHIVAVSAAVANLAAVPSLESVSDVLKTLSSVAASARGVLEGTDAVLARMAAFASAATGSASQVTRALKDAQPALDAISSVLMKANSYYSLDDLLGDPDEAVKLVSQVTAALAGLDSVLVVFSDPALFEVGMRNIAVTAEAIDAVIRIGTYAGSFVPSTRIMLSAAAPAATTVLDVIGGALSSTFGISLRDVFSAAGAAIGGVSPSALSGAVLALSELERLGERLPTVNVVTVAQDALMGVADVQGTITLVSSISERIRTRASQSLVALSSLPRLAESLVSNVPSAIAAVKLAAEAADMVASDLAARTAQGVAYD